MYTTVYINGPQFTTTHPQVRKLIRDKLGEPTPLNQGTSTKIRKKRRINKSSLTGRPGTGSSSAGAAGATGGGADDTASLVSTYTYQTATSSATKNSQPDFLRLPAEYEKVCGGGVSM